MSLRSNPLWIRFLGDSRPSAIRGFKEELLKRLSEDDVIELVALCKRDEPETEVDAALRLVMDLARRKDTRLHPSLREEWLTAVRRLARSLYPRHRTGLAAFQAWREHARSEAELFAAVELPVDALHHDELALHHLIVDLRSLAAYGSSPAFKRLEELKDLPEKVRMERDAALREVRPARREDIEGMAEEYRRTRSPEVLHRMYYNYIGGLPAGKVRVADLVKLLGEPDERLGNVVWYQPNQGTSLSLEADAEGFLKASGLA